MTHEVTIAAAASVDAASVRGTGGFHKTWADIEVDPLAGKIRWRSLFDSPYPDFRRLDRLSKIFAIAVEACGLAPEVLPEQQRARTALILASSTGCLTADLRFEASLHATSGIEPAVFPYTLPSTCLGEIAIRHRLTGPTLCLSVRDGDEKEGLTAAEEILHALEAEAALVCLGDWLPPDRAMQVGLASKTHAAALLLHTADPDTETALSLADVKTDPLTDLDRLITA